MAYTCFSIYCVIFELLYEFSLYIPSYCVNCIYLDINPPQKDATQVQCLSGVWQVRIQSFPSPKPVSIPKLEQSLPYYLLIAEEIIVIFIPFQSGLALCEKQTASSRI